MLEGRFERECSKAEIIYCISKRGEENIKAIEKARLIAQAALDKKAHDIVIMDMRGAANITDYFVICSVPSTRRAETVSREIEQVLLREGIRYSHIEGKKEALWVLIDYGDVIAHVFYESTREFYNLERLWHDAPKEHFFTSCISSKSKKNSSSP